MKFLTIRPEIQKLIDYIKSNESKFEARFVHYDKMISDGHVTLYYSGYISVGFNRLRVFWGLESGLVHEIIDRFFKRKAEKQLQSEKNAEEQVLFNLQNLK